MPTEIARTPARRGQLSISMLAESQHGLVTRRQLVACGLTSNAIDRRLADGALHVVRRGV